MISPWAQPVEPGSLGLVASIRAPLGTPAPRQSQTETLSPTLSGHRLEPGHTEAIWATRATIGHDGSKPVWVSCPCQNPLQAQAGGVCDSPGQPPSAPSAAPPVPREPCPGGRDTQEAAPGCPLKQPPPSHHGSPSGVQPETLGGSLWRGAPRTGPACAPFPEVLAVPGANLGPHQPTPEQLQHLCPAVSVSLYHFPVKKRVQI